MLFLEILFTVLLAVVIGIFFYYVFKYTGPWGSFWTFLLILILAGLAAGRWIEPIGPVFYDVAWVPVLFVILLFALLMAAVTPTEPRQRYVTPAEKEEIEREEAPVLALGVVFWVFFLFLLVVTIAGFFRY
ncbi:MAG: hypothetical protein ACOC2E_04820 [Bacteroidota bacterium]